MRNTKNKSPMDGRRKDNDSDRRILYLQYTNPAAYPPLQHSSRLLARAGWQVLFLGTGALGSNSLRFPPHDNLQVFQMPFCPSGWRQKLHYVQFCFWIAGWALRWSPDWIYASDHLSTPIALLLSYWPDTRVIYHEHDSPSKPSVSWFMRLCLAARQKLACRAEMCILPNQQRAKIFVEETANNSNALCVWNCPARDEVALARPPFTDESLWLLYHGSIVPARLPLTVLRALARLPERVKLRIIGYETVGHIGYVSRLQTLASELGILERIQFLNAMSRYDLLKWCQTSDVGIALMPKNEGDLNTQNMTGASNKPFDYLACGLALLVSDLSDWSEIYVEPGYGSACNPEDPEGIACELRWFLEHPEEMRAMGERGRQRIATDWNYEAQFSPVFERLNEKLR